MKGKDKSRWRETAETQGGNDGCDNGRWRRWTTTAADDNDSDGGRQHRQTTKVADDNGTQDRTVNYEGEGGERAANNNGFRQKAKPSSQRV
jgi:hypothetical protein